MKQNAVSRIITNIIIIIVLGALLCAGIAYGGTSGKAFFGLGNLISIGETDGYSTDPLNVSADELDSLEIEWISGSISVEEGSEFSVRESYSGSDDALKMCWKLEGKTVRIAFCRSSGWKLFKKYGDKDLTVTLPESLINGMKELSVEAVSADIDISVSSIGLKVQKLSLDSVSGSIKSKGLSASEFESDTTSGELFFDGAADTLSVDTVSGGAEVILSSVPKKADFDSVSGEITLCLPDNSGFKASVSTVSGDFDSDFATEKNGSEYICGDKEADISLDSVSGDLNIRKK